MPISPDFCIPVVNIPIDDRKIARPSGTHYEEFDAEILRSIKNGDILHIEGNHKIIADYNPPAPHHPDGKKHTVLWIVQPDQNGAILPWHEQSLNTIVKDKVFLYNLQIYLDTLHERMNNKGYIYFVLGFAEPNRQYNKDIFHKRSLQSQVRMHIHVVEDMCVSEHAAEWWHPIEHSSNPKQEERLARLNHICNFAGERSIAEFTERLKMFGSKNTYSQTLLNQTLMRTVFGFESLFDALNNSLSLLRIHQEDWEIHARTITRSKKQFAGIEFNLKQLPVPCISFVFLNKQQRNDRRINSSYNIFALPFATSAGVPILKDGSLLTQTVPITKEPTSVISP